MNILNSLSHDIGDAHLVNSFKSRSDKHWSIPDTRIIYK